MIGDNENNDNEPVVETLIAEPADDEDARTSPQPRRIAMEDVEIMSPSDEPSTTTGTALTTRRRTDPERVFLVPVVTEQSVAADFKQSTRGEARYCHSTGAWFYWDEGIWNKDETRRAFNWVRTRARENSYGQSVKDQKIIQKASFARGVEAFAQADQDLATTIAFWDNDPMLLGTPRGTINLRTGKRLDPNPKHGITKRTAVAPLGSALCPLWLKFLNEATAGDEGLIRFLRQWCGYNLTGDTREHALLFIHGDGGNGKSVFLNTVQKIMGDYAVTAAMDTFTASKSDKHPTDLAMLRGARMVTASETEEGRAWAESRIKSLTGGDLITARFMRQDFFTYLPHFKLTIIGNHKPVLRNVDAAMRRRFNIVPFNNKPKEVDKQLEAKLLNEGSGILRWMINGCLDWQENGLVRPQSVIETTNTYFTDQDLFGQWLADNCDVVAADAPPEVRNNRWTPLKELYANWSDYADKAGAETPSRKVFTDAMARRGFEKRRRTLGEGYLGLWLKRQTTETDWGGER